MFSSSTRVQYLKTRVGALKVEAQKGKLTGNEIDGSDNRPAYHMAVLVTVVFFLSPPPLKINLFIFVKLMLFCFLF
jgi:hypothetical protein